MKINKKSNLNEKNRVTVILTAAAGGMKLKPVLYFKVRKKRYFKREYSIW